MARAFWSLFRPLKPQQALLFPYLFLAFFFLCFKHSAKQPLADKLPRF
jgi:hypothetical protein